MCNLRISAETEQEVVHRVGVHHFGDAEEIGRVALMQCQSCLPEKASGGCENCL